MSVSATSSHHASASQAHSSSGQSQNALARRALQAETARQQNDPQVETSHRPTRDISHQVDKTA